MANAAYKLQPKHMIANVNGSQQLIQPSNIAIVRKDSSIQTSIVYRDNNNGSEGSIRLGHAETQDTRHQEAIFKAVLLALREPWRQVVVDQEFTSIEYAEAPHLTPPQGFPIVETVSTTEQSRDEWATAFTISFGLNGEADEIEIILSKDEDFSTTYYEETIPVSATSYQTANFPNPSIGEDACLYIRIRFKKSIFYSAYYETTNLCNGQPPPGIVATSGEFNTATGILRLYYDLTLDISFQPNLGDYNVQGGLTITSVVVANNYVEFEITNGLIFSPTLSYQKSINDSEVVTSLQGFQARNIYNLPLTDVTP